MLLRTIHFGILAFGPLLFLSTVTGLVREEFPYCVELQDPLIKTVVIYRRESTDTPAEHELKVSTVGRIRVSKSAGGGVLSSLPTRLLSPSSLPPHPSSPPILFRPYPLPFP